MTRGTKEPVRTVVEAAYSRGDLVPHVAAWEALGREALEPNVFYEAGTILDVFSRLGQPPFFCFVFVYRVAEDGGRRLIGFFPFQTGRKGPRKILRCYNLLMHLNNYLSTPLVHRDHGAEAIDSLLAWMNTRPQKARLFGLHRISDSGPFARLLRERLAVQRHPYIIDGFHYRAFFSPAENAEAFLNRTLTTKKRKEYRRQLRRLGELGDLRFRTLAEGDDVTEWVDAFIGLEAASWKGKRGWTMQGLPGGRAFLLDLVQRLAGEGRILMHRIDLDGKPIAVKLNLVADGEKPAGSFAFKIAFDDAYARFSPGVLLELFNIEDLHARRAQIAWMDSCADPNHPMIDHLWDERRRIIYFTCGTRSLAGRLLIRLLQRHTAKAFRRMIRQGRPA